MKKALCLIIAVINIFLMFTSVNASVTDEVKKDLFELGIMVGDGKGDLRPDYNITRAEMVKMLCVASNLSMGIREENPFPDVSKAHWAYDYIGAAKLRGIINGDEKGNFNPESNVTNEEAVKMLVCLLGYEEMAETRSGFPAGYNAVGTQIGVTDGLQLNVNTAAVRGDAAVMIYNALDIPVMRKIKSDDADIYVVMDGTHGYERITLRGRFEGYDTSRGNISALSKKFASQYKYKEGDTEKSFALYPDIIYTSGVDKAEDGTEYECPAIYDELMAADLIDNMSVKFGGLKINTSLKSYKADYAVFREKLLVPVGLFEILGCDVHFNEETYVAEIKNENAILEIMPNLIGMRRDKAEGFWIPLEACGRIINNELYVPLEAVVRELGINIKLDSENKIIEAVG